MWSDNDIDNAFQRLNPPEPEPTPFPLDAWLRLESQLDKAVIERAVRRRLWQFFAAEVAVVLLVGLGWLLFRPTTTTPATAAAATTLAGRAAALAASGAPATGDITKETVRRPASTLTNNPPAATPNPALFPAPQALASAAAASGPQTSSTASPTASPTLASTASPTAATKAVATRVPAVSRVPETHPVPMVPTPALIGRSRTKWANAETPVRQQSSAHGLVAATKTRKAVRLSRERIAGAGRDGATASLDGRTAETYLEIGKHPKLKVSRLNTVAPGTDYAVAAEARNRVNARFPSTRTTSAAEAAGVAAGSGSTRPDAEAPTGTTSLALLAPRPVLAPAVELVPLPTPLATVVLAEMPPIKPEVPKPAREPRFYVALVGAPDVSTVKFARIEKPMANVGLQLEYRLTSRLRVNTGLLRSTKQYVARRADYDFGAYAQNVMHRYFDSVDGSCTVLDVPLNLRYDLLVRPQYRLYGSAGLSSFFMQREQYSYAYTENYRPGYWQGEWVNANRHYLSILNLSAGYEHALSTRWSLQAEPYLKIPLTGIGTGKLRLTSAGVFFGVRYGF